MQMTVFSVPFNKKPSHTAGRLGWLASLCGTSRGPWFKRGINLSFYFLLLSPSASPSIHLHRWFNVLKGWQRLAVNNYLSARLAPLCTALVILIRSKPTSLGLVGPCMHNYLISEPHLSCKSTRNYLSLMGFLGISEM